MKNSIYILLVEDDININSILAEYLRSREYKVDVAMNGKEGLTLAGKNYYDIILSDISMPKMNGYDMLSALRDGDNQTPFIFIAEQSDRDSILKAYRLGCDDYLTKPFMMEVIIAKINAIVRRCRIAQKDNQIEFHFGDVTYDSMRQKVGARKLSTRENELLYMLCQNMGNVVEKNRILLALWGQDTYFSSRSLSVYINHLRKIFAEHPSVHIMSVHNRGYKLVVEEERIE